MDSGDRLVPPWLAFVVAMVILAVTGTVCWAVILLVLHFTGGSHG